MIAQPLKAIATATTSNETMSLTEATEVDDISAAIVGASLGAVDLLKHIRRQPADAIELFHGCAYRNVEG
jgi:hypothetical protein